MNQPQRIYPDEVSIIENLGEWHVTIRENGQGVVRPFEVEAHAIRYAEGQRARLGLDKVARY